MLKQHIQHRRSLILLHSRLTVWVTGMFILLAVISQAQITTGYIVKGGPDTGVFSGGVLIGTTSKINYAPTEQRVLIDEKPGIVEGSWKDVTGINQNTTSLTKTAAGGWGNAGAASNSILDTLENGWVQYKVNNLSDVLAFGLSVSNVDAHYNSIDYAVMINAGQLYVYNQGQLVGNYGAAALNDSIRIARIGNVLFFTRNGILFYNREVDIKQPVMADVALYSQSMVFELKSSFAKPLTISLIDDIITQIGVRDTSSRIFDRFGNTYTYSGITKSGNNSNPQPQDVSCTPGYFSLDFVGDGFETNLAPNQQNMRDVLCQVFNDLSALIQPSQCNGTIPTVNIRVVTVPPGAPSNALGAATPYYTIPPSNTNTGIIDGDVWKAINSGVNDPTLFDGELQVRFTLPNNATWNFNPTSTNFPGQYDAYSVYLHEAIHLLGFNTLIGANGQSIAPGLSHHYSRYDSHLNSDNNGAFINWDNCYGAVFNVPVSNITAGCPHITFNGANAGTQPAFAPSPNYLQGTSLSHFDDNCPSPNSHNFVMNASLALNTFHRVPTAQEVNALKDLGYSTTGTFGAAPTVPTTGLPSGGQVVAGVDDGFINQCGINNDLQVCANNATITVQPLANDIGAVTFDCLVNVSGFGIVTNNNNTSFTFNPNGQTGVAMFTYIPVGAAPNFQRGNITSIRIIVSPCGSTCATPLSCNQICNPDFTIPLTCNDINAPFWFGCVSNWLNSHGTPQIMNSNQGYTSPNFNTSPDLALMGAGFGNDGGEGIITNVNIQPNRKYIFSYRRKIYSNFAPIDNIYVRLLNSTNLGGSNMPTVIESPIPTLPPLNFEILHETNITSYTDEQVTICFTTPNNGQSYDWLWIYPDQNTNSSSSIVLVDWVELMEDNFSAGPDQTITCGDVTVGLTPLCSIRNTTDLWTWGSNQSNDDQLFFTSNNHNQLTQNTTFTLTRIIPVNPGGIPSGCATNDDISVTINNSLQLTTATTGANCGANNGTANVTVTGGTAPYTYEWKDSINTIYINQGITGLTPGTYTITVTDANGCSNTATAVVNEVPLSAIISVNNNGQLCEGDSIKFTTALIDSATYNWSGPNNFSSALQNPAIANAGQNNSGAYILTVSVNGCTNGVDTAMVVVNPRPAKPTISGDTLICAGTQLFLNSPVIPGNVIYTWTTPNSTTVNGPNLFIPNATVANSGTYYFTITSNNCTSPKDSIPVTVDTVLAPSVNSNSPVCAGDTIKLFAAQIAGASYSWTGPNGFSSSTQNPIRVNALTAYAGTYSVTINVNGCTSAAGSTNVIIRPKPATPVITTNSPVCVGGAINLSTPAIAGGTYSWTYPNASTNTSQNPTITNATTADGGIYTLIVKDSLGCSSQIASKLVVVNPIPAAPTATNTGPVCVGNPITLTASNVTGATYSWTGPNSFASSAQNPIIPSTTLASAGTYTVTATVNGCASAAGTTFVTVTPGPTVTATPSSLSICSGGTGTINLSGNIIGTTFSWTVNQGANIFGGTGGSGNTISANLFNLGNTSGTATYTITPSNSGCNGTPLNYSVTVNPIPAVSPSVLSQTICSGNTTSIGLSSTVSGTNFSWTIGTQSSGIGGASASSGNTIAQILTNSSTSNGTVGYLVTGVSLAGCAASDTIGVNVTVKPQPVMQGTLTYTVCSGAAANVTLTSNIPSTYSWVASNNPNTVGESTTPQSGNIITDVINNSTTVAQTVTYTVTPTSSPGGCSGTPQTITVTVNPPSACCLAINYTIPTGGAQTSSLFGATVTGQNIAVNGNLTVNSNITFNNCNFIMAAGTKITVINSKILTLDNQTHIYSCTNMWDGIYVNAGGQLYIKGSTFIEDALNAVEIPNNGGYYNINGAIFNRNLKSVELKGYTNNYPGTIINTIVTSRNIVSYPNPLSNVTVATLKGNSSQSLTSWPSANLKAQNSQYKAVFGVHASDVKYILVGIDGGVSFTNIFDNVMCGINLIRTSSDIYNNRFQNLLNTTTVACQLGVTCYNIRGIGISTSGTPQSGNAIGNYTLNVGCTSCNGAGNQFINTHQAISSTNYKKVYIQKNTINNSTTGSTGTFSPPGYGNLGIMVKPAPGDSIIIRNNSINNCATGIFVNRVSGTTINHPKGLIVDNDSITASGSGYCTNAIYVADYTTSVFAQVSQINTNTIINAQNGIVLSNLKTTKILNNLINVLDAPTGARNGIKATGCYGVSILNNHTKSTSTTSASSNLLSYGIYLSQSRNMVVKCNLVENAGRSLVFEGNCMSPTNMGYGILQNTMRKAQYGFVLKSNGIIGTQGNATNKKSDNIWEGGAVNFSLAQTLVDNSQVSQSILYISNITSGLTATRPLTNLAISPAIAYSWGSSPSSTLRLSTGSTINCVANYGNWRSLSIGDAEYADELKALEKDSTQLPVYSDETHWQQKKYVYDEIENNPQLTDDNDLNNFHNAHLNHTIGKLAKVNDKILQGNFNAANAINNNISPANILEQNQQTVNTLILKSALQPDYIYTSIDSSMLMSIATQCPLAGGNAVYQARNLLMSIASNVIEFEDNCIDGSTKMKIVDSSASSQNNGLDYKLYPNPNDGNMVFEYSLQSESIGVFILYDISGRIISRYNLTEGSNNKLKISESNLNNGIYFYSVAVDGKVISNNKFLIIK